MNARAVPSAHLNYMILSFMCISFLYYFSYYFSFNPIQTGRGGGAFVPAMTLDVYNFFHKQAKPTKPGEISKTLSGNNLA